MDDEKKMTLGAEEEEEKQFHSWFPLSRSPVLSLSFLFFRLTLLARAPRAYDPTEARTRTRNASCSPRSPRSRDDCNLHKLSFHFDDDVAEAPAE